jgi:ABC-type sugar transport system ATPase subunit
MSYLLEARGIGKQFAGVKALDAVSFGVQLGAVHAVVGENGAGKSTLMKVLSGVYQPDAGEILLAGAAVKFANPRAAEAKGIAIIHQELNLVPSLSVAENIFLGREPKRFGFVDKRRIEREAQALLGKLEHKLEPQALVANLKIGDQQIVEIAKALSLEARVLIMDEPTTALSSSDVRKLFEVIRSLTTSGVGIVYISHKMDELFEIADEFTVLRDGKFVGHKAASETTPNELVRMMVGREILHLRASNRINELDELLSVENLSSRARDANGKRKLNNINFALHRGEVLGIGGLMGAGRTELLESLFGVHQVSNETRVTMSDARLTLNNPRQAVAAGIAFVSEDRKRQGLLLEMNVGNNITLAQLESYTRFGFVKEASENKVAREQVAQLAIKTPSINTAAINLSGGNQQKIVIAKWLLTAPKVLLLDEPTKGIDIKGKTEIYRLIETLAASGLGIVLVSSEMPELLALSDRIIVLREGAIAGTVERSEATEEKIIELATIG